MTPKEYAAAWYLAHRERELAKHRAWYAANRARHLDRQRDRYAVNGQQKREAVAAYRSTAAGMLAQVRSRAKERTA